MASEAEKEQAKLTATYINGIAITTFALGCLSPVLAAIYGTTATGMSPAKIASLGLFCFVLSIGLHISARRTLKRKLDR